MQQVIHHDSEATAHQHTWFPYTYGYFTEMRTWVESKPTYGQRFVYRCFNPIDNTWNVNKLGKYCDLVFMFSQPEQNGIITSQGVMFANLTDQNIMDIVTNYVLDDFQRDRLVYYCSHLEQPLPIQQLEWQRECRPDVTLIDYDPTYLTTRKVVSEVQLINQNRKIGEPAPKGLPVEMAKTTGQSHMDMYVRMDSKQWQDFNDSIEQDGLKAHFVSIQGEVARTNQVRSDALAVARKQVADFINSIPHSLFLDSIKPFGHTWDSWKQLELADLTRLEQYIDQSCKGRAEWVKTLAAQLDN